MILTISIQLLSQILVSAYRHSNMEYLKCLNEKKRKKKKGQKVYCPEHGLAPVLTTGPGGPGGPGGPATPLPPLGPGGPCKYRKI